VVRVGYSIPIMSKKGAFLFFLFCLGILHWLIFYNFGRLSFKAHDWPKELSYYSVIQQSLTRHFIPYHVSRVFQKTDRFLALPEILLSPQILALPFMKPGAFAIFNTLFMYTLGFLGCLLLRRKFALSNLAFLPLYLLFNFNGYITAHLAVGHSMWNGYFLLPFFFLLIFGLKEGRRDAALMVMEFSFFIFLLMLQGSFHMVVWCIYFLALFGIANRKCLKSIVLIIVLGMLLSCFRLVPAGMAFFKKEYPFFFISGYPGLRDFVRGLIIIKDVTYYPFTTKMGWWEFDAYIGIIGALFIAYYGIYLRFKERNFKEFDLPVFLLALLSFGSLYSCFANLPIPFANSERYSSRFFILPLLALTIISSVRLNKSKLFKSVAALAIAMLSFSLAKHSYIWSMAAIEKLSEISEADFTISRVIKNDPTYITSVNVTLAVSLIAFFALSGIYFWRRRKILLSHN
jgi:hypothetical protein